jgi:hypothetical protein
MALLVVPRSIPTITHFPRLFAGIDEMRAALSIGGGVSVLNSRCVIPGRYQAHRAAPALSRPACFGFHFTCSLFVLGRMGGPIRQHSRPHPPPPTFRRSFIFALWRLMLARDSGCRGTLILVSRCSLFDQQEPAWRTIRAPAARRVPWPAAAAHPSVTTELCWQGTAQGQGCADLR